MSRINNVDIFINVFNVNCDIENNCHKMNLSKNSIDVKLCHLLELDHTVSS